MQRRGSGGDAQNVRLSLRPLFDIGVIAKSSMGSLARHPRCASLMLGMRVTKGHGRDHDYSIRGGVTEYGNRG